MGPAQQCAEGVAHAAAGEPGDIVDATKGGEVAVTPGSR